MKECMGSHLYLEPFLHISLTDNISSERHKYAFSVRFMWEDFFVCSYSRAGTANLQGALHFNPNLMWLVWPSLKFYTFFSVIFFCLFFSAVFLLTASGLIFYRLQRTLHWAY